MRDSARPAGHPLRRLARRLLGRNELRRAADRIETAVIFSLVAAFLIAAVAAGASPGTATSPSRRRRRACGRPWGGTVPARSRHRPSRRSGGQVAKAQRNPTVRHPHHGDRPGHLPSTSRNLGPDMAGPLRRARSPSALPRGHDPLGLARRHHRHSVCHRRAHPLLHHLLCYTICRSALDRHRLAGWESAWAAVGARWTSHG
jgi:hypothetical protein